ncbi:hypothetical protein F383_14777 [Gossypium arboreum]|uniref:Uncharacterized protein n=1 Tax=Gossypium arboreum TaxID=29729 RepID=A0A0B0NL21_GOSAR|nr:hypothetical protein F383_14777 [Gossypium arboreum]
MDPHGQTTWACEPIFTDLLLRLHESPETSVNLL